MLTCGLGSTGTGVEPTHKHINKQLHRFSATKRTKKEIENYEIIVLTQ